MREKMNKIIFLFLQLSYSAKLLSNCYSAKFRAQNCSASEIVYVHYCKKICNCATVQF